MSDQQNMVWIRYAVKPDGNVADGRTFCRATPDQGVGTPDGMKVDQQGNLYGAGPGGLWISSSQGKHIGTIKMPEKVANCNWGHDEKMLYITSSSSVYRIRLKIPGVRP